MCQSVVAGYAVTTTVSLAGNRGTIEPLVISTRAACYIKGNYATYLAYRINKINIVLLIENQVT